MIKRLEREYHFLQRGAEPESSDNMFIQLYVFWFMKLEAWSLEKTANIDDKISSIEKVCK